MSFVKPTPLRYQTCIKYGLRPAGATLRRNDRNEYVIPPMCYDAGIGIFNPSKCYITSYEDSKKVYTLNREAIQNLLNLLNIQRYLKYQIRN